MLNEGKLTTIRKELNNASSGGFVKNIGKMFFSLYACSDRLQDVVYYGSRRHECDFELLSLDRQCFAGSKLHAEALMAAFGGRVVPSEYCTLPEKAKEIYVWERVTQWDRAKDLYNPNPLKMEDVLDAFFS